MTTLYKAKIEKSKFPNLHDLRESIFNSICMKETTLSSQGFTLDKRSKEIQFQLEPIGTVSIGYRVNYIPRDKVILLSFYPKWSGSSSDYDPKKWKKEENIKVATKTVELCDLLGALLNVSVKSYGNIQFSRVILSGFIDVSKWKVSIFGKQEMTLLEVLSNKEEIYKSIKEYVLTKNYTFILFSSVLNRDIDVNSRKKLERAIKILSGELEQFGEIDGPYDSLDYKYILESYPKRENIVAIFIENDDIIELIYKNFKKYLDVNNIPSQFISTNTILKRFKYPGVRLNFLLELFSKAEDQQKPLSLQPVPSLLNIDGILCLSDVKDASIRRLRKLFGALFMYTEPVAYEEVHIYEDILYDINGGQIIFKDDKSVKRLARYIYQLGGPEELVMDIILTKPWKRENLDRFIDQLSDFGYKVNRAYYISTIRSRFTDGTIVSSAVDESSINLDKYRHHYIIVSDSIAFIRTSTQLRIYPHMFNVYVELLWPDSECIDSEDIEKIIWLSKKRLYRFQEFFVTKIPEPVWIFKNIRKMYLGEISDRIKIPLRLMI